MKYNKNYNKYIRDNLRLKQESVQFFFRVARWENEVNWCNRRTDNMDVKHSWHRLPNKKQLGLPSGGGGRGGGVGGGSVPFPRVMMAQPSKCSAKKHKWVRSQGYLFARKISYRGNQTRWVVTNRIKEKGGPADTGLVHWACCSRRYRVTIKSSVGGDGGRVSRELFGKRRWKKNQES